ncbi:MULTISPECIES: SDR family oxidoreductase [unclassified Microbacterium]|uniref:SDR family NAD(P)-dependent oxidoreductase n=1 Tax=Microbacterium sp. zg-B185 TaxID=3049070 RepID=UPI0027D452CD|nr:SDR family oxidoreductase [Microbacterium sp. zg.B185]
MRSPRDCSRPASVIINGRSAETVERVAGELRAHDDDVTGIAADVTTAEGAQHLVAQAGRIDILVNNLGIFGSTPTLEITDEEWLRYFDVNVVSAARLTRELLPAMMSRGWGRVLNIASDSAIVIPEEMIHYGATKTAMLALSRGSAKAAAGSGVTVNSVIVGPTRTPGVEDFVYQLVDRDLPWEEAQREFMRKARPQSLLGRLIEPVEIANMVAYLSSPLACHDRCGRTRRRRLRRFDRALTRTRAGRIVAISARAVSSQESSSRFSGLLGQEVAHARRSIWLRTPAQGAAPPWVVLQSAVRRARFASN